jgi:lipopolysaccharide/colanic/teichoic acid biosynthesis glycosyltransferase
MTAHERIVGFLLICVSFLFALLVYSWLFLGGLGPYGMLGGSAISIIAFWVAVELRNGGRAEPGSGSWWVVFIEQFCVGTGANLLLHSVFTYALSVRRTPILITLGGLFAAASTTLYARFNARKGEEGKRFLLLGFDSITARVIGALRQPLIGVIAASPHAVPSGLPYLGGFSEFEKVLAECQPTNIVVEMREWSQHINPTLLLNCRLAGVQIEGAPDLYERLFNRVCCERLRPGDLILSPTLRGDSRTIAVQSIYTNLIGLTLFLLLVPAMIVVALLVFLFSGPGAVLETHECAGFQHIPFRLLRFRTTRRDGTAEPTTIGKWILRMRLSNLPQLLNIIRGDMTLVGPLPVRSEFAAYLAEAMPFYSHRFSVKPGILSWASIHSDEGEAFPDECRQVEYDLFYLKEGSIWVDVQVILEGLGRVKRRRNSAPRSGENAGARH